MCQPHRGQNVEYRKRGNQRSINRGRNRHDHRRRHRGNRHPCGRRPRGPPGPRPPPPPVRKPLSSASLTLIVRPSNSVSFISLMAVAAFSSLAKVTNANPRDRPVSRSVITVASAISPNREKAPAGPRLSYPNSIRPQTVSSTFLQELLLWRRRVPSARPSTHRVSVGLTSFPERWPRWPPSISATYTRLRPFCNSVLKKRKQIFGWITYHKRTGSASGNPLILAE